MSRLYLPGFLICLLFNAAPAAAQDRLPFDEWLGALRQEVLAAGVSEASVDLAFSEITPPVQRIIEADRSQPETVQTYDAYLKARVSEWKVANGRSRIADNRELLESIAESYGVQARFIVAFWGMETNFGTYPITESVFNVLATLAYDNRRGEMFRAQFIEAAKLLDSGFPGYENMKSSWAGAMGQVQFMPDTYLRFAVDQDGDGRRDIWNTDADVFASIANLLKSVGWDDSQTWGRRVRLPPGGETRLAAPQKDGLAPDRYCRSYNSLGAWRDLQQWQALGVRQEDGTDLPARSLPAALVIGDKGDDEAFLVYRNFCSIMRYNPAFKYALSIGLLSDQYTDTEKPPEMKYTGGCHCGSLRFEVEAPEHLEVDRCNYSICSMSGFLHLIVPRDRFLLLQGEDSITTYTFNTGVARHTFCRVCGIKPFYIPRSNPDGIDVNINCLDALPADMRIVEFDGKQWEQHAHKLVHKSRTP